MEPVTYQQIVLEKVKMGMRVVLEKSGLNPELLSTNIIEDYLCNRITVELVAKLLASKPYEIRRDMTSVPRTWWDMLKLTWFPKWWLAIFPIQTREIATVVLMQKVCPHLVDAYQGAHVTFLATSE